MGKHLVHLFISLFLVLLPGCGGSSKKSGYIVGIDPTWFPLQTAGLEKNILAFSIDLLVEIAKIQHLSLAVEQMNWDNLLWGLREKRYSAALSSLRPYAFYQEEYTFSPRFLETGPVLVLPKESKISKIDQMKGGKVGVVRGSSAALLMQMTPGILVQGYLSIPETLIALKNGEIDGAAIEVLIAQKYVQDLYEGTFRIASYPFTDEGIRLVTLHHQHLELMKKFEKGLTQLKKDGTYQKLLSKWGLSPDGQHTAHLSQQIDLFLNTHLR